jgi:uncharacterized small protein (DUF1192 family)
MQSSSAPPARRRFARARAFTLAAGLALAAAARAGVDATPTAEERLERRVEELAEQLAKVQAELARLKAERAGAAAVAAAASAPPAAPAPPAAASAPSPGLSLWGYGEAYLTRPTHVPADTQADLARAVFGIGYRFNERTSFNSEFEVEHAVTSSSDVGEFEVEQFFLEHQIAPWGAVRAGLFLMPFGLLNENHEPTHFYGVQRNFVETLIIPSTWREGGFELNAHGESGLALSAGITTGFDLSKWSFAPQYPPYHTALDLAVSHVAPLQATHQELALANAAHPSAHLALNYSGLPGLRVGGAVFSGAAVGVPAPASAPSFGTPRVTLWEGHARWAPAGFDLSAVYARGTITNTAAANLANAGSPNPIPSAFDGYYLQAAYADGLALERYRLAPFLRYEYYTLGAAYAGAAPVLPAGLVPLSPGAGAYGTWPLGHDRVLTAGASLYLTPDVVLKLDYQSFEVNRDFSRVDLGLGLSF